MDSILMVMKNNHAAPDMIADSRSISASSYLEMSFVGGVGGFGSGNLGGSIISSL